MNKFFKSSEVSLQNGGYLYGNPESPITNPEFVTAQKEAEWVVTLAEVAKEKDLKGKQADTIDSIVAEAKKLLAAKDTEYIKIEEIKEGKLHSQLKEEALAFHKTQESNSVNSKVNTYMQRFNVLNDFETHGLFFTDGIVKLNKIYTIAEITKAVSQVINLL